jgi:hypothetical protein
MARGSVYLLSSDPQVLGFSMYFPFPPEHTNLDTLLYLM